MSYKNEDRRPGDYKICQDEGFFESSLIKLK